MGMFGSGSANKHVWLFLSVCFFCSLFFFLVPRFAAGRWKTTPPLARSCLLPAWTAMELKGGLEVCLLCLLAQTSVQVKNALLPSSCKAWQPLATWREPEPGEEQTRLTMDSQ